MTYRRWTLFQRTVLLATSLAVVSPFLSAQERGRFYAGLSFSYSGIRGSNFDGKTTNVLANMNTGYYDVYASVPKVDPGPGALVTLGVGGDSLSIEFNVQYSSNTGPALGNISFENATGVSVKSNCTSLLLNLRYRLGPRWTVRPYILGGFNFSFLNVKRVMYNSVSVGLQPGSDTEQIYEWQLVGDAGYVGLGLQAGAGVDIALGKHLVLTGGVLVRPTFYSEVVLNPDKSSFPSDAYDTKIAAMLGVNLAAVVGLQFWFGNQ